MATTSFRAENFPDLTDEVMYPRLSEAKMEKMAKKGARQSFAPGDVLVEQGQRDAPFMIVERGRVNILDRKPGKEVWVAEADAGTFLGDIAIFTGEPAIAAHVAAEPTDVITIERVKLRAMLARWPEMGEMLLPAMAARREWHERNGHGVLRLIAPRGSRRAFEVRDLLQRNLMPVRWYDVDTDEESQTMLDWLGIPPEETPVLVRNQTVLRNPSAAQVARELGLRAEVDGQRFDLVVLGGGPAGLAAAVYGGSEGLRTLVTEAWAPGGQAGTSTRIENYLGFPTGVAGAEHGEVEALAFHLGAEPERPGDLRRGRVAHHAVGVDQHGRLLVRDLQPLEQLGALLVGVDVVPADRQQVPLEQVPDLERAAGAAGGDEPHDAVPLRLVPRAAGEQRAEDVLAELGPARDHVAQAGPVELDHVRRLRGDARADRRLAGERGDVADERPAVGLGDVDVLARLAVDELDETALEDEERRVAHRVLVEHLAGLERAARAALGEPRQLGIGEAREQHLVGKIGEALAAHHARRGHPAEASRRRRARPRSSG